MTNMDMDIVNVVLGLNAILLVWMGRIHWICKRTLDMHNDPDSSFSTVKTNELLSSHMKQEEDMHRDTLHIMERLDITMNRLATFIEKLIEVQTGKPVPPPRKQ